MPNSATAATFHIDDIFPGEGVESDCFTVSHRVNAKPPSGQDKVLNIFESTGHYAFIKIDGHIHELSYAPNTGGDSKATAYTAENLLVTENHIVSKVEKAIDGNTYYLKGSLTVAYKGQSQNSQGARY
ncbi:hypothetical protein MMA231_01093 [Asticcacaulis sp. MM231]|uniref:hypothetical protein n=1 Tax=Asticcacaulis sp. MM231 TaxID=3157666 RepID=UPI0032D591C4